jgi:small subunit ribosomal protein S8
MLPHANVPHSRLKENIARVLQHEGYVADIVVEGKPFKTIKIKLKYTGRKCVIEGLRRVSSPGLRRYLGAQEVPRVLGGLGVSILSTSEGVMTGMQARKKNVGGELLCEVW